ncbi:ADP-ribosylglycohydrolase family protein [Robertkochia marina]|uniref:ADP-ribosylglycohydrolase family protein n=1 Tax=Robertkochia marina TaxID=1227945 RepID=UPI001F551E60|nr:ADP-ribosylglycohydrolase family protein [Robertkochia marina]
MHKPARIIGDSLWVSKSAYADKLYGFWLGQCIGNWTGLVTEMDKIGNVGDTKTGAFYTRDEWGQPDEPSIWGEGVPSELSKNIDFVFKGQGEIWGADDDTDMEYMYQHLLLTHKTPYLTPKQIRQGWLHHIHEKEENYLWVSNQKAFDLMQNGMLPPATSDPENNPHFDMIDAQLTTEIFGLFAPGHPETALKMAWLPIRVTARKEAALIAEFYITMHSLAILPSNQEPESQIMEIATIARAQVPDTTYVAKMFDFVASCYISGIPWEATRDSVYNRYQVQQMDGYTVTSRNLYCNGCFAGGINFAASLISLFYGKGNLPETIKIGTLAGWDSDNPTATWGGLLGFIYGKDGIEKAFGRSFSDKFNIHRTRKNFEPYAIDNFRHMAINGVKVTEMTILKELNGRVDKGSNSWVIPWNIPKK